MAGRKWIFIRGLSRGQGHWADFPELFLKRFPEDEIEFLDLPGNGLRFRETSCVDVAAAAQALREKSRWVSERKKVHMLAHSLGSMVAMEWMRNHPDDFERLAMLNTSGRDLGGPWRRFNPRQLPTLSRLVTARDAFEKERITLSVIANNPQRAEELLARLAAYTASHPVSWENTLRQILSAARVIFPKEAPGKVLLIGSRGDRLVSVENTITLARRWGLEPALHPWAGHDLPVDDPQWLIEQLL